MASNVPGYETAHFARLDGTTGFIEAAVQYLLNAAEKASTLNTEEQHSELMQYINSKKVSAQMFHNNGQTKKIAAYIEKQKRCYGRLHCLGFNSSGYDLPALIKQGLYFYLQKRYSLPTMIKNQQKYTSLRTHHLHFLDILSYCGEKTNLQTFLRTWDVTEDFDEKLFFPYKALQETHFLRGS